MRDQMTLSSAVKHASVLRRTARLALAGLLMLAGSMSAPAEATHLRTAPKWQTWSADCGNAGVCAASTFARSQNTWVDVRIVRDWQATAQPLVRITTNLPLKADGEVALKVDGTEIDRLPVAQLREIQDAVTTPAGFRPLGGDGFWYPAGPATQDLLAAMVSGQKLVLELAADPAPNTAEIPLEGFGNAMIWLDTRQGKAGTVAAIVNKGDQPATDAPHGTPVLSPDSLPEAVRSLWDLSLSCAGIDPAIFTSLDAIYTVLDETTTLYLLPCGAPSAFNTPYVAIRVGAGEDIQQVHAARMSEAGPIATGIFYNAKWNPGHMELDGLLKRSGLGECGAWNRWKWIGGTFVLVEEATRQTCDGVETSVAKWQTIWPIRP